MRRLCRVKIGFRLVDCSLTDETLLTQAQRSLVVGSRVDVLRRGAGGHLACFASIDLHQEIALAHRLPGIDVHFDDAPGNLRRHRRLIDRFDERVSGQRLFDRMRLHDHHRQGLRLDGQGDGGSQAGEQRLPE